MKKFLIIPILVLFSFILLGSLSNRINANFVSNTYDLSLTSENCLIEVLDSQNNILSAGENVIKHGDTITLNIEAEEGCTILCILVNGVETANGSTISVNADLIISAFSTPITFDLVSIGDVTLTFYQNETAINPGENVLTFGQAYTFNFGTEEGYLIDSVLINGVAFNGTYSITAYEDLRFEFTTYQPFVVTSNIENVVVKCTIDRVPEVINELNNTSDLGVRAGDILTLWVYSVETGYTLNTFTINGETFTSGETIIVSGNITVNATATLNTYNLTTTGDNATINLVSGETTITAGDNVLTYGQTATLNVIAEEGYQIDSILVNGVATENGATITFTENLSIEVVSSLMSTFDAIPEGMTFLFDNTTMTATVSDYTGTATNIVIPRTVSATLTSNEFLCTLNSENDFDTNRTLLENSLSENYFYALLNLVNNETIVYPYDVYASEYIAFSGGDYIVNLNNVGKCEGADGGAFFNCDTLTSITIPDTVYSIGYSTFACCYNLTSIVIPDSVLSIGSYAFADCFSLVSITIYNTLQEIGMQAFIGGASLTDIYYTGTETEWNAIVNINNWLIDSNYTTIHYNYEYVA